MPNFTHTHTRTLTRDNTVYGNDPIDYTSGQEINISESIPSNQTNLQVAIAFDKDKLKSIFIVSDVAMTLEFNNSTTGVPTITLVADTPFMWASSDAYFTNPFSAASVTTLYVTNTTAGTLTIFALVDPT